MKFPSKYFMKNETYDLVKWGFIFSCILIICFDGVVRLFSPGYTTGSLNFLRSIGLVSISAVLAFFLKSLRLSRSEMMLYPILGMVIISSLLVSSLSEGDVSIIPEILNVVQFLMLLAVLKSMGHTHPEDLRKTAYFISFFYVVPISAVGLFSGQADALGRFSGFQVASSIYGMTTAVLSYILVALSRKGYVKFLICGWSIFLIVQSGTRAGLLCFVALLFYDIFRSHSASFKYFLLSLLGTGMLGVVAFFNRIMSIILSSEIRAISAADLESGSIGTRAIWYYRTFKSLAEGSYLGGNGVNSYRIFTDGHILHFDLLRYWHDYGASAVLCLCLTYFLSLLELSFVWKIYIIISVYIMIGFHNFHQAPDLILVVALLISITTAKFSGQSERPFAARS